jgi:hypothetical protein
MEQQFEDIKILLQGINTVLLMKEVGDEIKPDNSFVRLFLTEEAKIGGGHRVKRIRVNDAWKKMSANDVDTYYGQVFTYKTKDYDGTSISSGVASYEPTNGGDEISLREPVDYSVERFFYANDYKFQETPFGEMFYPNPQVVYSKVKVEDLPWTNDSDDPNDPDKIGGSVKELVTESKTGFTIYEYYTAKEFPVYGYRTSIDDESKERDGWDQFFDYKKETYKNLGVSQGYSFVVNDMHGKLKSITTYPESSDGENKSLSSVVYHYRSEVLDHDQIKAPFKIYKLGNQVEVVNTKGEISKNGNTIKSVLGESIDLTYDTHKGVVNSRAINHQFNGDFMPGPFAIPLPVVSYFKNESEHTERFMRSVFTKLVTRTGILKSVEAQDMGAVSITENLKYDSETGAVLLSKTHNSYNDPVYHFNYPAHWIYEEMDMASKNHGLRIKTDDLVQVYTNTNARPISNYPGHSLKTPELFNCGDEVLIKNNTKSEVKKAWVNCGCEKYLVDINGKSLTQLPNDPNQHLSVDFIGLTNTSQDELELIVLRSGNRNSQNVPVSSIASKDDPTSVISSGNPLNEVLSSSHQDFKDNWRTYGVYRDQYSIESNCKYNTPCADEYLYPKGELVYNPYTTGVRGNWYPYKGYYFKENISSGGKNRTNGRYTLIPYWKYSSNNGWVKNSATGMDKWKSTGEVDAIGPNGVAYQIKSVDDRYSSSLQGYNRATIANAVNAKKEEIINLNFEDQEYRELGDRNGDYCFDPHDPIEYEVLTKSHYSEDFAHTGKYSMKIGAETAFKTNLAFEFDESTDPMICPNILLNYDNLIRPYRVSNRKHVINFWIKVGVDHIKSGNALYQYDLSQIEVKLENCDAPAGSVGDYLDEDGDGNVDSYRTTRIVEGWQQIQYVFDASNKIHGKSLKFQIINNSNEDIYIDDIRFHPFDANMTTSVYDPLTMRLVAQMDSENFTVFYDYDESGNMIRARRETEEGIYTINESRFSVVKKDL